MLQGGARAVKSFGPATRSFSRNKKASRTLLYGRTWRQFCTHKIEDSEDEKRILPSPPRHEEAPQHSFEWAYPIIVGAVGGLITAGAYFLFNQEKETEVKKVVTPSAPVIAGDEDGMLGEDEEEEPIEVPPVSPMQAINSFPYLPEDTRELDTTFRFAGSFGIALGPKEFNTYHLINDYLSDSRHAIVFSVSPKSYSSSLFRSPPGEIQEVGRIRTLLRNSLSSTIDFGLIPMLEHVGNDVLEQLSQLIQQRGPSSDQFIWIDNFDVLIDYIDQLEDPVAKAQEQADLRCLMHWLVDMSLHREWTQVLIQSNDPQLLTRLEPYWPLRTCPEVSKISLGERCTKDMEDRLKQLLIMNEICLTDDEIQFVLKNLGGSASVLENAVKLLIAGHSLQRIVDSQIRPIVVGMEELLLESPYRVALWELMEKLVENYETTGNLYMSHRLVKYSPTARETLADAWSKISDYIFFYETPTVEMLKQRDTIALPSGYISATSTRAMTAFTLLVNDPDLKRVMWEEKKKLSQNEKFSFFESSLK